MTDGSVGTLYLVATPIGNLEDITLRALRILKAVDRVLAEDTRHSGQLLKHFQIQKPLLSYHAHNQAQRTPELVIQLQAGESMALISDAGMPGISDPGHLLTLACIAVGIPVVPIPGATAAITALVGSGFATDRFVFEGFLPSPATARQESLTRLQIEPRTLIFYEAPHRLTATLTAMIEAWGGERSVCVARELTKLHEEFWRGSLQLALTYFQAHPPRGEITLVVAGSVPLDLPVSEADLRRELQDLIKAGVSRSQASRQLAQQLGRDRRELYRLALTLQGSEPQVTSLDMDP